MSKKSFKNDNPALAFITPKEQIKGQLKLDKEGNPIEAPTEQDTQEVQQDTNTQQKHPTQGKKGKKLPRINMAFSNDNLEYLQLISRIEGVSMTQYVNNLLEADRGAKADIIEKAKTILKGVE